MVPAFVRQAILPLHEAILGRSTFSILRKLETETNVASMRATGLEQLLRHASDHIPYWTERLRGRVGAITEADPASALAAVPVLTRAEIRHHREAMRWQAPAGKVLIHASGGTTDDNLTFYWGRPRQSWDRAMRYRGLGRFGIRPGDRVLHIWPRYPARSSAGRVRQGLRDVRDWLINDMVIDPRPLTAERIDQVLRYAARYRPGAIIGYPSWLMALAERMRDGYARLQLPTLQLVLCTGEVLYDFQRCFLGETFAAAVAQEYGSQDAGLIAHEDPQGVLRHNAEQMVVECLRGGQPAPAGELGEVVITHFHTQIMPFIRYATGDVVRQLPPTVGTPGLPRFPLPEGRTSDLLVRTDGSLSPGRPVVEALVERAGFRDFNLHQLAADHIIFREVAGKRPGRRAEAEAVLREMLGPGLRLEWRTGSGFVPFTSGKKRFVCSPTALPLIAHDRESGLSRARRWPQRLIEENQVAD